MKERDDELMGNISINEYQEVAEGYSVSASEAAWFIQWAIDNAKENADIGLNASLADIKSNVEHAHRNRLIDDEDYTTFKKAIEDFEKKQQEKPKQGELVATITKCTICKHGQSLYVGAWSEVEHKYIGAYPSISELMQLIPNKKIVEERFVVTPQGRKVHDGYDWASEELINAQLKGLRIVYKEIDGKNKILEVF